VSKFKKKPVVIDAVEYAGNGNLHHRYAHRVPEWLFAALEKGDAFGGPGGSLLINTLEGQHRADAGDWIIRGIKGELYPCKPDIFASTYDAADDAVDESGA
jgi:hypothetical protein